MGWSKDKKRGKKRKIKERKKVETNVAGYSEVLEEQANVHMQKYIKRKELRKLAQVQEINTRVYTSKYTNKYKENEEYTYT